MKDAGDRTPGRNMLSVASNASLDNISVEYNEGSVIAKRQSLLKKSNFLRKSQSVSRVVSGRISPMQEKSSADLTEALD